VQQQLQRAPPQQQQLNHHHNHQQQQGVQGVLDALLHRSSSSGGGIGSFNPSGSSGYGQVAGPLGEAVKAVLLSKGPITSSEVHDEASAVSALTERLCAIRQHLESNGWRIHDGQLQPIPEQQRPSAQEQQKHCHIQQQQQPRGLLVHQLLRPQPELGSSAWTSREQAPGVAARPPPSIPMPSLGAGVLTSASVAGWGELQAAQAFDVAGSEDRLQQEAWRLLRLQQQYEASCKQTH
jgi:hypothetical protein